MLSTNSGVHNGSPRAKFEDIETAIDSHLRNLFKLRLKDKSSSKTIESVLRTIASKIVRPITSPDDMAAYALDMYSFSNSALEWITIDPARGGDANNIMFRDILFLNYWIDNCELLHKGLFNIDVKGANITFLPKPDIDYTAHLLSQWVFSQGLPTQDLPAQLGMFLSSLGSEGIKALINGAYESDSLSSFFNTILHNTSEDKYNAIERFACLILLLLSAGNIIQLGNKRSPFTDGGFIKIRRDVVKKYYELLFPQYYALYPDCEHSTIAIFGEYEQDVAKRYRHALAFEERGFYKSSFLQLQGKVEPTEFIVEYNSRVLNDNSLNDIYSNAKAERLHATFIKVLKGNWTYYEGYSLPDEDGDVDGVLYDNGTLVLVQSKWNYMGNTWRDITRVQRYLEEGREQAIKSLKYKECALQHCRQRGINADEVRNIYGMVVSYNTMGVNTQLIGDNVIVVSLPLIKLLSSKKVRLNDLFELIREYSVKIADVTPFDHLECKFDRYKITLLLGRDDKVMYGSYLE